MTKFNTSSPAAPGAEARLTQKFTEELLRSFNEHGATTIKALLESKPDAYLRLIAGLPTAAEPANPIQGLTNDELDHALALIRKTVSARNGDRKRTRAAADDEPAEPLQALPEAEGVP